MTRLTGRTLRAVSALARCREGSAILEFTLVLPILLALVGGCFELGRALLIYQSMTEAVRSGARTLARLPDPTCRNGCGYGVTGAVERARAAIAARGGLAAERVKVVPMLETAPGTVGLRAEVGLTPEIFAGFGLDRTLTLRASHQEMRVGE